MSVQIKFEAGQDYQLEAIDSVTSLFAGWVKPESLEIVDLGVDGDALYAESLRPNPWGIDDLDLLENIKEIQARTRLTETLVVSDIIPTEMRLKFTDNASIRDFSIEMETGTGKTYVYVRTALELFLKYGISKFVIVVPSVAIREGVLSSLSMLKEHFKDVYAGLNYESYAYDSKHLNRLRQFATGNIIQILVMNIQAFNRDTAIIQREAENGIRPIDYVSNVRPVVILDEPQKMDARVTRAAIEKLNPLFRLRYSATHRDAKCLVYRLGPIDAYQKKLVKKIEVLSMVADENHNIPYVELLKVTPPQTGRPTATLLVNRNGERKRVPIKVQDDLAKLTDMQIYDGWVVEDILLASVENPAHVLFTNGRSVSLGNSNDIDLDWWHRAQIQAAIESHFETEVRLNLAASRGEILPMKPLTLFFIDKVSNYDPEEGKFKTWFDQIYDDLLKRDRRFRNLELPPAAQAREGYFATSKSGRAVDSRGDGDSNDDLTAYDKIMKKKEVLLSFDEPVRFIFSHSALSEGWDNPNVFTICNLRETRSIALRRQQIGRGLRLPVMADGSRCRLDRYNVLTIVASESFQDFAKALQTEMKVDDLESFEGMIVNARSRVDVKLQADYQDLPGYKELWSAISPRTEYQLQFRTEDLVDEAIQRLQIIGREDPVFPPRITINRARVAMDLTGIAAENGQRTKMEKIEGKQRIPDILRDLQDALPVSRATLVKIIVGSDRAADLAANPAKFAQQVRQATNSAFSHTLVNNSGIRYTRIAGPDGVYEPRFETIRAYSDNVVRVTKSIYDGVVVDSDIERKFAIDMQNRSDIELFIKLPDWFKIATPLGGYNPDWAVVQKRGGDERRVYLVVETKGTTQLENLRFETERWKIEFGNQHYMAIEVKYRVMSDASQFDVDIPLKLEKSKDRKFQI